MRYLLTATLLAAGAWAEEKIVAPPVLKRSAAVAAKQEPVPVDAIPLRTFIPPIGPEVLEAIRVGEQSGGTSHT